MKIQKIYSFFLGHIYQSERCHSVKINAKINNSALIAWTIKATSSAIDLSCRSVLLTTAAEMFHHQSQSVLSETWKS